MRPLLLALLLMLAAPAPAEEAEVVETPYSAQKVVVDFYFNDVEGTRERRPPGGLSTSQPAAHVRNEMGSAASSRRSDPSRFSRFRQPSRRSKPTLNPTPLHSAGNTPGRRRVGQQPRKDA